MTRVVLFLVLGFIVLRVFSRLASSFMEGLSGRERGPAGNAPPHGVQMVRDPVCGTFVLPERAVTLHNGRVNVFFCSNACRDKYRARTA